MAGEQGDKNEQISDADKRMDALMDMIRDACVKMDESGKRLDARMDAMEENFRKADSDRRDAEEAEREKGEAKEPVGDRKDSDKEDEKEEKREDRKDAKEDEREERKDSDKEDEKREDRKDARKDEDEKREDRKDEDEKEKKGEAEADAAPLSRAEAAELRAQIASLNARAPAIISDADRERFAAYQEQADPAFQAFGDRAPAPLQGETPLQYKRRLGAKLQGHSPRWKEARLSAVSDDAMLDTVVGDIYADAISAARRGTDVPAGQLREIVHQSGGHTIISFEGGPDSWMNAFAGNSQRATGSFLRPQ